MGLFSSLFGDTETVDAVTVDAVAEAEKALNYNTDLVTKNQDTLTSIASYFSGLYDTLLSDDVKNLEAQTISNATALTSGELPEDWLQNVLRGSAELYGGTGGTTGALGTEFGTRQSTNYYKNLLGGSMNLMQYGETLANQISDTYTQRANTGISAASLWLDQNYLSTSTAINTALQNASMQNQVNLANVSAKNSSGDLFSNLLSSVVGGVSGVLTGGAGMGLANSLSTLFSNSATKKTTK